MTTRCTAHMAQFCACRFKRPSPWSRLRAFVHTITPRIDLGNWP